MNEGAIVMTQQEWIAGYPDRTNIIREGSPLGWPVGTKTTLFYDQKHGTCLAPVLINDNLTQAQLAVLESMVPGKWYQPRTIKTAAGMRKATAEYNGLLSGLYGLGYLVHGNGTTTHGFMRPTDR